MRTIRRLYFYLVALISLEVVLWGLIGLLRSIFSSRLVNTADALAQALALVLVGVPIFLFHWLWSQRAAAKDEEERTASLRGIFFYAALIATLVPVVQNLLALVDRSILLLTDLNRSLAFLGGEQTWQDNFIAILINGVAAAYFWNVLRIVWKSLPDEENFADVRRLYRYLWLLYSLLMAVFGAQQLLRFVFYFPVPTNMLGGAGREMFLNGLALLLVGTPLWVYTWHICQGALSAPAEKISNLRLGVLYLLSLIGVISVLSAGGTLLSILLRWAFGEVFETYELIDEIGGPLSLGLPLAAVWAYYGSWLNRQIVSDDAVTRRAGKKRFYFYVLSALGLGAAFVGVALVFSFVIDLTTSNAFWGASLRPRLAGALASLAVGLPLWLQTWRPMQAEALIDDDSGEHARRSNIRRAYLYLALFAGVIGGMVSAVGLVYNLINAALTGDIDAGFLADVLNSLQLLGLFAILLVYHLSVMRFDNTQASETLETRRREFPVLVLDPGDETFVKTMTAAMLKHASGVPVVVQPVDKSGKTKVNDAKAVILPASLALNPPDGLRKWLNAYNGVKIVVAEAVSGWVMTALTPEQAARSAQQVAEGDQVHLARPSTAWEVVKNIAVVLVGIELFFFLLSLAISFIVD